MLWLREEKLCLLYTSEWNKVTNKSFDNDLKRGDLKVTKTAEDGLNEGLKFHLYGCLLYTSSARWTPAIWIGASLLPP